MKSGIFTTEFWLSAAGTVGNLILVLVILGVVSRADQQSLTTVATELVAGLGAVVVNGAVIYRYIVSRETIKTEHIRATPMEGQSLPPMD